MKKARIQILIIFLIAFLITGCEGFNPASPNDIYDEENTVLDYIKVFPTQMTMNVNESKKFEVKAYNSDNKLIAIDPSQVKWACKYECINCGIVWKLSPTQGSTQTTFTPTNPEKIGKFEVWANYGGVEGKWAKAKVEVY